MTEEEVLVIQNSWKIFQRIDPVLVGDVFYSRLFATDPGLEQMFGTSKSDQSKKLIEMFNIIIGRLDRLDELTEDIRQLAIRHVKYGVKPCHYGAVGNALLWTLAQGLGKDWNQKTESAWVACYTLLSETMIAGAATSD